MLMDGQTDMTKFIVAFCNFANVHKNCLGYPCCFIGMPVNSHMLGVHFLYTQPAGLPVTLHQFHISR